MARPQPGSTPKPQRDQQRAPRKPVAAAVAVHPRKSWQELLTLEQLKEWCPKGTGTSYGVSIALHLLAVFVLSFLVLEGAKRQEVDVVTAFSDVESDVVLDEIVPLAVELPGGGGPSDTLQQTLALRASNLDPVLGLARSQGGVAGSGGGGGGGDGTGFRMPGKAVTKGSFTAWTVPEDPKPRQDYLIVIQIQLPASVTDYKKEDIAGYMEGDDGYRTPIGDYRGNKFDKKYYGDFDMRAKQFVIKIPGAAEKVKDVIQVRSKVLKEEQVLEIVF